MNNVQRLLLVVVVALLAGCASSGPKTRFYTLFANAQPNSDAVIENTQATFGVGPILLPEYLENPAVVSRTSSQQLRVSGVHAWGGDLKSTLSRVLSANLANLWQQDKVWAFPWDTRARPQYQLRIVFEDFSGVRGGEVKLAARWSMLDRENPDKLRVGSQALTVQTASEGVGDYVAALNRALDEFCLALALQVKEQLQ